MQDFDRQAKEMLETVIHALDALNSWVRSPSYREADWSDNGPLHAVYFYKVLAIKRALGLQLPTGTRRVKSVVTCRGCSGTGRYVDSYGDVFNHCYDCHNTGRVTLYFIETEFACGVKWHTPREKYPYELLNGERRYADESYEETNWKPNQPGKDLTLEEVCRRLNIVETYFTERPKPHHWTYDYGSGVRDDAKYVLFVGETDQRKCSFCDRAPRNSRWCVRRGRLGWRDHCCDECEKRLKGEFKSAFDAFPLPEYLLEGDEVRKWMRRNFIDVAELRPQKALEAVPF